MKKTNRSTILREKKRQARAEKRQEEKAKGKKDKALAMTRLAYHYLKVVGIKPVCSRCDGIKIVEGEKCKQCRGTGKYYDANKIAKGLSKIYRECGKDEEKAKSRITEAGEYFNSKSLSWTPEAVWRDWELIQQWKKQDESKLDVSERRKL